MLQDCILSCPLVGSCAISIAFFVFVFVFGWSGLSSDLRFLDCEPESVELGLKL